MTKPKRGWTQTTKTFDPACLDLARHFSEDADPLTEAELHELACDLQDTVERYFSFRASAAEEVSEGDEF